jgi:hypothetical protein
LLINMRMRCKLFAVVKGQRLDPGSHWFELAPMTVSHSQ